MRKEGDIVGDYRLVRESGEGELTQTWEAEQISMQRPVMLEMLRPRAVEDEGVRASFLADVKAKALVSHSGVGAVYEGVANEEAVLFARERLAGESLETLQQDGEELSPLEVVKLLGQISDTMRHLESEGVTTMGYGLRDFIVGSGQQVRLMNLAVDGVRDERVDTEAKQLLGAVFHEMLQVGQPGATRVGSLCGFMADRERAMPLSWAQIGDLSEQVREQLQGSGPIEPPIVAEAPYVVHKPMKIPPAFWALLGGVSLIAGLVALLIFTGGDKRPEAVERVEAVTPYLEIPVGEYSVGKVKVVEIRESYAISRTEVTLAQYHAFLEFPNLKKFQHPEQPSSKKDHLPNDWKEMWAAAVKGQRWEDRPMSTDCPVVGVDWWDAYAYARWSQSRLPTLTEWVVAAHYQGPPPRAKGWGAVGDTGSAHESDRDETGGGLIGMAGGVREWTRDPEVDPDDQLSPMKPTAAGASFLNKSKGIRTRVWFEDRGARRSDLGFRVVLVK